ncbi:MAG: hypothetical protein RMJ83_03780, partial [Armatimonadota bacterium]|nr:hypothetical protein [Armatimonadota bacterium]
MRRWLLASLLAFLGWHQAMPQLQPLLVLQGTGTYSPTIDISQSGTWLGVAPSLRVLSTDVGAKVWNLVSNEVSAIPVNTSALLRFVPDTDSLAVLSVDSDITAYSPRRLNRWYWVPILRVFLPGRSFEVAPQFSAVAAVDVAGRVLVARGLRVDILTPPSVHARVAFSPDGALLAVLSSYYVAGSEVSEVRLYRVSDLAVVWARQLPFAGRGLAFAPNGRYLAVAGADGQIRLWDLSTNQEWEVAARGVWVGALQFSPDSALLATGETSSTSRFVRLWRTPDLILHAELPVEATPLDVAFHPTQNQLYVALWGGAIDTWTLQPPYQSQLFARYWRSFGFRRNSRELWLSDGSYIYVYDGSGQLLQRFPAWVRDDPYSNTRVVAVSPDRQWYATHAGIWRLQNQQLV